MRVTPELEVLDTVYICNQVGGQNIPAITFNSTNYITVWYDPGLSEGIVAARITPQGAVLDPGISLGPGDDDPDIASAANRSLAVWSRDFNGVFGRLLDDQAQPVDTFFRVAQIGASGTSPRIESDGHDFLIAWADFGPSGDLDVFGRIVTGTGQMPEEVFPIARGSAVQKDPSLCFDGSRYLVVWLEDDNKIIGQSIGTDGKLIGVPFQISDTSSRARQYPAVAALSGDYLAAWAEYHEGFDIYAGIGNAINISERGMDRIAGLSVAPNPFRSAIKIGAGIRDEGLGISIYDAAGKLVKVLSLPASVFWNGLDRDGRSVPAGVYFLRMDDGRQVKMVKIR